MNSVNILQKEAGSIKIGKVRKAIKVKADDYRRKKKVYIIAYILGNFENILYMCDTAENLEKRGGGQ